ncbi:MAG: hypothetical protein NVS9B15_10250 [Acidobacteriaceae bacterium]
MSASFSNLPRQSPLTPLSVERGKPVSSVSYFRNTPNRQPVPRSATLFAMPKEPEDARLTGGTRSLERRLLALNFATPKSIKGPVRDTLSA